MKKKVMIVVEDTDNGNFEVYCTGDTERIGEIANDKLSAAEYWSGKLFEICGEVLKNAGVAKREIKTDLQ